MAGHCYNGIFLPVAISKPIQELKYEHATSVKTKQTFDYD